MVKDCDCDGVESLLKTLLRALYLYFDLQKSHQISFLNTTTYSQKCYLFEALRNEPFCTRWVIRGVDAFGPC